jgi:hypothetical protein
MVHKTGFWAVGAPLLNKAALRFHPASRHGDGSEDDHERVDRTKVIGLRVREIVGEWKE